MNIPKKRLYSLGYPYLKYIIMGFFGALANGAVFPLWGLMISLTITSFFGINPDDVRKDAGNNGLLFLSLGFLALFGNIC